MSIAPVQCTVDVKASSARAFELFAQNMGVWWPRGKTPGASPHAALVIEPRKGGRWFERDAEGDETQWGKVLAWEPPRRLLLGVEAEAFAGKVRSGWPERMENFAQYVASHA